MKRKPPLPSRRLPIDFGAELLCPVPIQTNQGGALPSGTLSASRLRADSKPKTQNSPLVNGNHATASPSGADRSPAALLNRKSAIVNRKSRRGFTLVEILVVLALLSLITFALMAVFSTTQRAFRASLTQNDTLEGGRAVIDLIAADLETMTPSYDVSNYFVNSGQIETINAVNFRTFVNANFTFPPSPLVQNLVGSPDNAMRTNVLQNIFILSKTSLNGVPSWIGSGYFVNSNLPDGTLYPLYRFYMSTNASSGARGENGLFNQFANFQVTNAAVWSHLMDGVINLTMRAYDTNGIWVTNGYYNSSSLPIIPAQNVACFANSYGEMNCYFFSNAVPASVLVTLGTLEDRVLAHAEGLAGINQSNYLANEAGQTHLFTRRVWIRNLDLAAYQ